MAAEPIVIHSPPDEVAARSESPARAPQRPFPLEPDTARTRGSSEFFCSKARCDFHVRVGDPNVNGFGDWETLKSGITVSHRWIDGHLLCDLCAARKMRARSDR
jgi:hypothetical protein